MKRIAQIDYLKGFAIIFVIMEHSMTTKQMDFIGGAYYILQAVPVFLILFGYNTIHSYINKGIVNFGDCYKKSYLIKRIKRILVPLIYIWILEFFIAIITKQPIAIKGIGYEFIVGGWGQGAYFIPIILQFVILIPLLYKIAQNNRYIMLISAFIINMIFELFSYYTNISNSIYRVASLRFLFVAAIGVYLALYEIKRKKLFLIGVLFSLVYITSIEYFGVNFPVYHLWGSQNAPSFLLPFALVVVGLKKFPSESKTLIWRYLGKIGGKSYHIFLFQALYFISLGRLTAHLIIYIAIPINVLLCICLGLVFYKIESKISKYLFLYKQNNLKESVTQ